MRTVHRKKNGILVLMLILCLLLSGCEGEESKTKDELSAMEVIQVLVDGEVWSEAEEMPASVAEPDLMVYVYRADEILFTAPFSENHQIRILQPDGSENTILMTGDLVRMEDANCGNQDCVQMGDVTRENLEERILGGFIICLPHQIVVEVREP